MQEEKELVVAVSFCCDSSKGKAARKVAICGGRPSSDNDDDNNRGKETRKGDYCCSHQSCNGDDGKKERNSRRSLPLLSLQ